VKNSSAVKTAKPAAMRGMMRRDIVLCAGVRAHKFLVLSSEIREILDPRGLCDVAREDGQ